MESAEMAEITKDLKYYLANPEEMPTDPKLIEQLARETMQAALGTNEQDLTIDRYVTTEPVNKDERTGASSDAEAKLAEEAKQKADAEALAAQKAKEEVDAAKVAADAEALKVAEAAAQTAKAPETKPEGILAKDGKNVIPYAVLTSARERAEAAERLAAERARELEQLKAEKSGKATEQALEAEVLSDEELAALAEDSPTLAKILKAQQDHIAQQDEAIRNLATHATQQIVDAETEAKSEVQAAIDSNPVLSAWQVDADQSRWDEAARLDKALRESPLWRNKSFDERFAKVVELTKATFGDEAEPVVEQVKDVKVEKQPSPTAAEIQAAAEAKLAAKSKAALPVSLSSIPGGTPPAVDEKDRVEQMSSVELGNKFLGMTQEQLQAYLATF